MQKQRKSSPACESSSESSNNKTLCASISCSASRVSTVAVIKDEDLSRSISAMDNTLTPSAMDNTLIP